MKLAFRALALATIICLPLLAKAQIYDTNNDVVEVFAGSGTIGSLNAQGALAMFSGPQYVVADTLSNLYVWDSGNSLIRKITPDGTTSNFASLPIPTYAGAGGMAIDGNGTIWITASSGIYEVNSSGSSTFLTYSGVSSRSGICTDSGNNIYYTAGNQVYRISSTGVLSLWAGNTSAGSTDATGIYASFSAPGALAIDQAANLYVWDSSNRKIRRIDQNQTVTTIAGNGNATDADGVGLATAFANVYAMCADNFGNIILACGTSIRKMSATTNLTTLAGSFSQNSYANGAGSLARFSGAGGVCLSQGMIFVADSNNQRVRQISFNPQPQIVSAANLDLHSYAGLTITGLVGRTYQIQSSPDMGAWTTRTTILLNSSPYLWIDQNPIGGSQYYRAVLLP